MLSLLNWAPVLISVLALLFAVGSFWWMNWRPGKLNVGNIRCFGAGKASEGNPNAKNIVTACLPLILWNSGARPLLIEDLRLVSVGTPALPTLFFEGVDDKLTLSVLEPNDQIKRDYFFLPVALKPNEVVRANFLFQARNQENMKFEAARYRTLLQARCSTSARWYTIMDLEFNFCGLDSMGLYKLNEEYAVFRYPVDEKASPSVSGRFSG